MNTIAPEPPTKAVLEPDAVQPLGPTLAAIGALLAAASVGVEFIYPVQAPDGSITQPLVLAAYLAVWIIGWILVAVGALGAMSLFRPGRMPVIGCRLIVFGAVTLALSAAAGVVEIFTDLRFEVVLAPDEHSQIEQRLFPLALLVLLAYLSLTAGCVLLTLSSWPTWRAARVAYAIAAVGLLMTPLLVVGPLRNPVLIGGLIALAAAWGFVRRGQPKTG